jgi:hypothetical protein
MTLKVIDTLWPIDEQLALSYKPKLKVYEN